MNSCCKIPVLYMLSFQQAAARKRCRRHLMDTDKYVKGNNEVILMDIETITKCSSKNEIDLHDIRNEIFNDIDIQNQRVVPR